MDCRFVVKVNTYLKSKRESEGIWYLLRDADGWKLYYYLFFQKLGIEDHSAYWEQCLAPFLGQRYNLSEYQRKELALHPYGFPRGRVAKAANCFVVYHGDDWKPFPLKSKVKKTFHLTGRTKWIFDEHEVRLPWDVESIGSILKIDIGLV